MNLRRILSAGAAAPSLLALAHTAWKALETPYLQKPKK